MRYRIFHIEWMLCLAFYLFSSEAAAQNAVTMQTNRQVAVYGSPSRGHAPIARIHYGAVLLVEKTGQYNGCKKGWVRLQSGGFVCSAYLIDTSREAAVAPEDNPDINDGMERYIVTKGGAVSFKNKMLFQQRRKGRFFYRGTVLAVTRTIERGGSLYLITRDGLYVHGENVQKMNPVWRLGQTVEGNRYVVGYAIDENTPVYRATSQDSGVLRYLKQFEVIESDRLLESTDGWISLPSGGFARDASVARVRNMELGFRPEEGEKWIAVDLAEQVVSAFVGERRVFVTLASTGKKGNTERGSFRIKWKRRIQTMNLYGGHLRVDDVQWVMYYIPQRGFALHTAWHREFGYPVSHGCVNLPREDARWLYNWVSPASAPFDSENFHTDFEKGTRVIVF